jgi:hypothetical protein
VNSTTPDDVFGDSFIQSTRIADIVISGSYSASKRTHRASITFRRDGSSPIRFLVGGDRSAALMFERDLINELAAGKQWYSLFVLSFYPWYFFVATIVAAILIIAFGAMKANYIPSSTFDFLFSRTMPALVLWPFLLILLDIAFPPIIFNLGGGARRQKVRIGIVSFILLTIVVGLLVNLSSDFLKGWLTKGPTGAHS